MHRRNAISPGFFGHYQDLGISSLKGMILRICNSILFFWAAHPHLYVRLKVTLESYLPLNPRFKCWKVVEMVKTKRFSKNVASPSTHTHTHTHGLLCALFGLDLFTRYTQIFIKKQTWWFIEDVLRGRLTAAQHLEHVLHNSRTHLRNNKES